MDSKAVQSQVHENNEYLPHNDESQEVPVHDAEALHSDHEKKSVLNKVKAKAKQIKDTIKKHGHNILDYDHEYNNNQDQHSPGDHNLNKDEEMAEDQGDHGAPVDESEAVKSAAPTSEQVENLGKSGVDFGDTTVMREEPSHEPRVIGVSPTAGTDQNLVTDPAKTFVGEEKPGQRKVNLERPTGLEEDPRVPGSRPEAYTPPNHQTKVTDPNVQGVDQIDIKPVEESFSRMNVQNEPQTNPVRSIIAETQYPSAGSHDEFEPDLSTETKSQHPSAESHGEHLPELSSAMKTQYLSAGSHDEFEPDLSTETKSQHPSAESHDEHLPELSSAMKTQYPSAGIHDQFVPAVSTATETQNPSAGSPDQFAPDILSTTTNRYPDNVEATGQTFADPTRAGIDEIDIKPVEESLARMNVQDEPKTNPEPNIIAETEYPSAGSHDQFVPGFSSPTETQHLSTESDDQHLPELSSATKTEHPSAGIHDRFEPEISTATETQYPSGGNPDQFSTDAITTTTNRYPENPEAAGQTFSSTTVEEQPRNEPLEKPSNQNSYTDKISSATSAMADKAVSAKNAVASKLGYGEKGDRDNKETAHEEQKSEDASNKSGSAAEYGKSISQKLAPVYGKVAGVGSGMKSKVSGTRTGDSTGVGTETENEVKEQDKKGVSVKDYLAEKLWPGEEDKALSEVISEALYKRKDEPKKASGDEDRDVSDAVDMQEEEPVVKERGNLTSGDEKSENSPREGVVNKLKGVVGTWFGKSGENQSSQVAGGEDLSKNKNPDEQVKQVGQSEDEKKLQESSN